MLDRRCGHTPRISVLEIVAGLIESETANSNTPVKSIIPSAWLSGGVSRVAMAHIKRRRQLVLPGWRYGFRVEF
jgi:hypothetical protein